MGNPRLLYVDDDAGLQTVVGHFLTEEGYDVTSASCSAEVTECLEKTGFDVFLLDLMLPDSTGMAIIRTVRERSASPVIIVSGKSDTTEKIVGLELGADDYITKPFEMRELAARIRAVLRRSAPDTKIANQNQSVRTAFSGWYLDPEKYQAFSDDGTSKNLTSGEFRLLEILARSRNKVVSRNHLYEATRQEGYDTFDRAIDIQIARIRKKLGDNPKSPELIKTIRGVGYMLCAG